MVVTKKTNRKGSGKYERMNYRVDQMRPVDDYRQALENFKVPDPSELNREFGEVTVHPDPLIEEYFNVVAMTGTSMVKWSIVKDAFIWKLEKVLDDIRLVEDDLKPVAYIDKRLTSEELDAMKTFMVEKAKTFENAPFTIQRLCELLALPTVHYRIAEKFYRAIEKNINVVMEVTEDGKRITGIEEPMFFDDDAASSICETEDHLEKHFLVCVDEVDKPLEEQKRASMERSDSSEDDEESRGSFRTPLKYEVLDRPETPPPNEEVLRLSTDEVVPMEQQFGVFGNKKKSPFKEPMIDMFADITEDHLHHKRSPSSSQEGVFLAPELPVKSPHKRESSVDNSGDAHALTDQELQEEIPTKMPHGDIPEPMDS